MGSAKRLWHRLAWRLRGKSVPATWSLEVPTLPAVYYNEVLPDDRAIEEAIARLGWTHPTPSKTWDFLKAAHFIQARYPDRGAPVLDAGCVGSPILEWLYGRGYRRLFGVDLDDHSLPAVPGLVFRRASLTETPFPDRSFDAITCISVLEHGVDQEAFLTEAARLLRPGGALLISTDFREPAIETADVPRSATFNLPWVVFDRRGIERFIDRGSAHALDLFQPIRWEAPRSPVMWNGKRYTFIFLALLRR